MESKSIFSGKLAFFLFFPILTLVATLLFMIPDNWILQKVDKPNVANRIGVDQLEKMAEKNPNATFHLLVKIPKKTDFQSTACEVCDYDNPDDKVVLRGNFSRFDENEPIGVDVKYVEPNGKEKPYFVAEYSRSFRSLNFYEALFTAASAVGMNGLVLRGAHEFAFLGKVFLLIFLEISAICVPLFICTTLMTLESGISSNGSVAAVDMDVDFQCKCGVSLPKFICLFTLFCQGVGAVLLIIFSTVWWSGDWSFLEWIKKCGDMVFLSISSFTNAGFSPYPDSIVGCPVVVKCVCFALNMLGGMGVYVALDLYNRIWCGKLRLSLHTKIVFVMTIAMFLIGALVILPYCVKSRYCEWYDAFFLSASARTCGLTSFDVSTLPSGLQVWLIILMMIGGAPGSLAGGIKVTTFMIVLWTVGSTLRNREDVIIFKRKIPAENIRRAFSITTIFILIYVISVVLLQQCAPDASPLQVSFEVASALSSTGLSINGTDMLGKGYWLLILLMLFGRVGPFALLMFFFPHRKGCKISYLEERVIIG